MAPWPRGATCTTAPRGQGAMPELVHSSEGLGLTRGSEQPSFELAWHKYSRVPMGTCDLCSSGRVATTLHLRSTPALGSLMLKWVMLNWALAAMTLPSGVSNSIASDVLFHPLAGTGKSGMRVRPMPESWNASVTSRSSTMFMGDAISVWSSGSGTGAGVGCRWASCA